MDYEEYANDRGQEQQKCHEKPEPLVLFATGALLWLSEVLRVVLFGNLLHFAVRAALILVLIPSLRSEEYLFCFHEIIVVTTGRRIDILVRAASNRAIRFIYCCGRFVEIIATLSQRNFVASPILRSPPSIILLTFFDRAHRHMVHNIVINAI